MNTAALNPFGGAARVADYPWDYDLASRRTDLTCPDCTLPFTGHSDRLRCRYCAGRGKGLFEFLRDYGVVLGERWGRTACADAEAVIRAENAHPVFKPARPLRDPARAQLGAANAAYVNTPTTWRPR